MNDTFLLCIRRWWCIVQYKSHYRIFKSFVHSLKTLGIQYFDYNKGVGILNYRNSKSGRVLKKLPVDSLRNYRPETFSCTFELVGEYASS